LDKRGETVSLNEKARTLNELLWENITEWNEWLCLGLTEQRQIELSPKYQEKWVRLDDVKHEIEKIHRKYEALISEAEKDCAGCYLDLKQKLQQLLNEFPDITMIEVEFKRSDPNKTFCIYFKTTEDVKKFSEFIQELIDKVKTNEE